MCIRDSSLSSVNALRGNTSSHFLVHRIHALLGSFEDGVCIQVIWIPSHVGIEEHDLIDEAAKEAGLIGRKINIGYSVSEFRLLVYKSCLSLWQSLWNRESSILTKVKPLIQDWSYTYNIGRRNQVILARLRMGTIKLTHAHFFENRPPSICVHCNVRLTLQHLFFECPTFRVHIDLSLIHISEPT